MSQCQGCEARATLGHRPQNIPNRIAVMFTEFMLHMQQKVVMGQARPAPALSGLNVRSCRLASRSTSTRRPDSSGLPQIIGRQNPGRQQPRRLSGFALGVLSRGHVEEHQPPLTIPRLKLALFSRYAGAVVRRGCIRRICSRPYSPHPPFGHPSPLVWARDWLHPRGRVARRGFGLPGFQTSAARGRGTGGKADG